MVASENTSFGIQRAKNGTLALVRNMVMDGVLKWTVMILIPLLGVCLVSTRKPFTHHNGSSSFSNIRDIVHGHLIRTAG